MAKSLQLTHTSGGTWVRTSVMTSGLTISAFCHSILIQSIQTKSNS